MRIGMEEAVRFVSGVGLTAAAAFSIAAYTEFGKGINEVSDRAIATHVSTPAPDQVLLFSPSESDPNHFAHGGIWVAMAFGGLAVAGGFSYVAHDLKNERETAANRVYYSPITQSGQYGAPSQVSPHQLQVVPLQAPMTRPQSPHVSSFPLPPVPPPTRGYSPYPQR
jgi:hypothetical protein